MKGIDPLKIFAVLCIFIFFLPVSLLFSGNVVTEKIMFVDNDGENFLYYESLRSSWASYSLYFWKNGGLDPEEHLKNYYFIFPNRYEWFADDPTYDVLKFPQGSYSSLNRFNMGSYHSVDKEGVHTYKNWDGVRRDKDGHYGFWNIPDNFENFVCVWVFPKEFRILDHTCNQKGEWELRQNTLAFYGKDINDVVFTVRYQKIQVPGPVIIAGDRVMLTAAELFSANDIEMSGETMARVDQFLSSLKKAPAKKIIISGYISADDQGKLQWARTSEQALKIRNYLLERGSTDRIDIRLSVSGTPGFELLSE